MHRVSQKFWQQDLFEQIAWQLKWFSTIRSQLNLVAVSYDTFVFIQQSTGRDGWHFVWVGWSLHLCCGFQCCLCWTGLCCWSYGLRCQQCKGMAWKCQCWRYLDFYRKRVNPTWQSLTQVRTDGREGNSGRWKSSWACRVQVCILTHGGWLMQSTGIKIDWCWHLP